MNTLYNLEIAILWVNNKSLFPLHSLGQQIQNVLVDQSTNSIENEENNLKSTDDREPSSESEKTSKETCESISIVINCNINCYQSYLLAISNQYWPRSCLYSHVSELPK